MEAAATPRACFDAVRDFEAYPQRSSDVEAVRLLGDDIVESA